MASGMAEIGQEKASTAWGKEAHKKPLQTEEETSSESESEWEADKIPSQTEEATSSESDREVDKHLPIYDDDDDDEDEVEAVIPKAGSAAAMFGHHGVISVLFETPSGFAIFAYDAAKLTEPDALKHIWADFVNVPKAIVWLRAFQTFKDKAHAITATTVSPELTKMIRKYVVNGQTLAVGKQEYKKVIENILEIPCLCTPPVKELMWGLWNQMRRLVPEENSELINEDRFPMSEGMAILLNHHKFEVNIKMMVTKRIIEMASVVYECDRCVDKHKDTLRFSAKHLMEISHLETKDWDLLKLATAFKLICYPEEEIAAAQQLFPNQLLIRLIEDAPQYEDKISKTPCLEVYKEICNARKIRLEAAQVLARLLKRAKKAHEAEQASKAAIDHEIGPDRKKIFRGIDPVTIDEHTKWHTTLSAKHMGRQVPQTMAPVSVLERYTQISSHPLNLMKPGILSMDIHPLKDLVATGGIFYI